MRIDMLDESIADGTGWNSKRAGECCESLKAFLN